MYRKDWTRRLALMLLAGTTALLFATGLSFLLARSHVQAQSGMKALAWTTDKTVDQTVAAPGDVLTYTITIQNDNAGVDVWMTDTLPAELTYLAGSLDWYGPGSAGVAGNTITWTATNFGWQTILITLSAEISPEISYAEIVNTAQFTGTGSLVEFSSEETTVVAAIGNLDNEGTYKTVDPQDQVEPGDVLTYIIRLTNDSTDPVYGVQVIDELPPGLALVDGSIVTDVGSYVAQNDVITWTLDMDGNWGNIDLVFQADVLPYEGLVTNTARLTAPGLQPLTLTSPAVDVYQRHPNLQVTKSVSPDQARPGELLTYTVHIVNTGDDDAETVWMTDALPSEVVYQPGSCDVSRGSCSETNGVITWEVAPGGTLILPSLEEASITFTVQISPNINKNISFINTAEVTGAGTLEQAQVSASTMVTTYIYLPILFKRWPPVPYAPTLHDIDNSNQDPDYTVSWSYTYSNIPVISYTLQEATNPGFTANLEEYNLGSSTSYIIGDKDNGTYYYRVRGNNSYGPGPWSNVESTTVFVFEYFDDFSDYTSGWPRAWERTYGALYEVHPYEHPKCPGSNCEYNGNGYVIARRASSQPYARFGPGITIPSENYVIEYDARWWDAQYHATYKVFFGSDSSFSKNYYSIDVLIDDPSILPSHCSYRVTRRIDGSGTKELQVWKRVSNSVIDCQVRSQDSDTPWNHFEIRREDNWITVYANDTELGSWYDDTYGADLYFGVGATLYEGLTPSEPEFDNFSVEIIP